MEKYKNIEGIWYVTDKNNQLRKVTSKKILDGLNSIDTSIESKSQLESSGLGDTVKKITNFLGIKTCEPCEERRKDWNKRYPYLNYENMDKLTEEEEIILLNGKKDLVPYSDAKPVFDLYNKIFKPKPLVEYCNCPGTYKTLLERLTLLSTK